MLEMPQRGDLNFLECSAIWSAILAAAIYWLPDIYSPETVGIPCLD